MKNIFRILTSLMMCFSSNSYSDVVKSPSIIVFHINGVNTSLREAIKNIDALKSTSYISSNMVSWDLLYNPTSGNLASDLLDTLRQKKQEGKGLNIDDYVRTYIKAYNLDYPIDSSEYTKLKENIKQNYMNDPSFVGAKLSTIVDQFHKKTLPAYMASVIGLLHEYKSENSNNAYVLLLPHSQGNLYANQLWDFLVHSDNFPADHLAIFGIANPADKLNGLVNPAELLWLKNQDPSDKRRYLTANNDFVIAALKTFSNFIPETNAPMTANIHLSRCTDLLCHGLTEAYLKDRESAYVISKQINLFIIELKRNLIEQNILPGGGIRMLYYDAASLHSDLIDSHERILCSTGSCDGNVFNYLFTLHSHYDRYDYNYLGFTNRLDAGEYLVSLHGKFGSIEPFIRGHIVSAISYTLSRDCQLNAAQVMYIDQSSPFINVPTAILAGETPFDCSKNFPEFYHNGKYIAGRFILN